MTDYPSHKNQLNALKRVEGQIRGVQKMIEEGQYCVDILTQLNACVGAILRVEDEVLENHLNHCVADSFKGKSDLEKQKKIKEVVDLIKKFRKTS